MDELSKAKSNLEQYLLISTSEGEAKEQYQEYVRNNFDRVFEGYSFDQMSIVGRIFTEHVPKSNGVAIIDECVISTLEVIDKIEGDRIRKLNLLKEYNEILTKEYLGPEVLIQGNELIKHYLNTDILPVFVTNFESVTPSFGEISSGLNEEEIILRAANYFSQGEVKNFLVENQNNPLGFNKIFYSLCNIMNLPGEFEGVNPQKILGDFILKRIGNINSDDFSDLYREFNHVIRNSFLVYEKISSIKPIEGVSPNSLKNDLIKSYLSLLPKVNRHEKLFNIFYKFSGHSKTDIPFRYEILLGVVNSFRNISEVLPDDTDFYSMVSSIHDCLVTHNGGFNDVILALNFIEEGNRNNSLDLNYLSDAVNLSYGELRDRVRNRVDYPFPEYLPRPNVVKLLKSHGGNGNLNRNSKKKDEDNPLIQLFHLFELLLSQDKKEDLNINRVDIKEDFISGTCNILNTCEPHNDSSLNLIKNIHRLTHRYYVGDENSTNYLREFITLKEELLKYSTEKNYQTHLIPLINEYFSKKHSSFDLGELFKLIEVNGFEKINLTAFAEYNTIYSGWNYQSKYSSNVKTINELVKTYDLLENTLVQGIEISTSRFFRRKDKEKREELKGKLKQSFINSLNELVDLYKDENDQVQENEIITYCQRIYNSILDDHFDVLAFIDEGYQLRGVQ